MGNDGKLFLRTGVEEEKKHFLRGAFKLAYGLT